MLDEFKRIYLGEFIDDLKIGEKMMKAFTIDGDYSEVPEEKLGTDRVGEKSFFANFGATFFFLNLFIIVFVLLIILAVVLFKRFGVSQKNKERLEKMKRKIFFNSLIRYAFLSSLKTNLIAFVTLKKASSDDPLSIIMASLLSIAIIVFPFFLARILFKNKDNLNDEANVKKFGTLYEGKNIIREKHHAWL